MNDEEPLISKSLANTLTHEVMTYDPDEPLCPDYAREHIIWILEGFFMGEELD